MIFVIRVTVRTALFFEKREWGTAKRMGSFAASGDSGERLRKNRDKREGAKKTVFLSGRGNPEEGGKRKGRE
ncbi:hypothetical protein [Marispirochaeta aestuarii]|uniref:hypothetical protein n=1 Tax=Marispirochaeta aestuarii TaxID=1963862 RepID=UPI0029C79A98|nr:hypothetical protein [Marispirochaeta aestuarii]